jgi:hypothetical protein
LTGTVVSSLGGSLTLKLSKLTVLPSKQKVTLTRKLVLSVASDIKVDLPANGPIIGTLPKLEAVKPGFAATVYTVPALVTLEAQRGDDDTLVASRIVLR